jgi:hypothetical protein
MLLQVAKLRWVRLFLDMTDQRQFADKSIGERQA